MGGVDDFCCNTGLVLGLGLSSSPVEIKSKIKLNRLQSFKVRDPLLTLCLSGDHHSGSSSLSVKRERESDEDEDEEVDDGSKPAGRKKLRLTKAQSKLLEDNFKDHTTLNPKQKQDLARELKLSPRQVEVWFQNRRARTKLKQTEVDCEFLKKWCETLRDENRRLQKEVHALKLAKPIYVQLPAATLTVCPACERADNAFKMAPNRRLYSTTTPLASPITRQQLVD